jgi:trans-aconitate 2-methyltransferase
VTTHTWDPDRYLAYADQRGRPFVELLARVSADGPGTVVDLGCGAGNLTLLLAQRWPEARVLGVDSSPEMIEKARELDGAEFVVGDVRDWRPRAPVDVLISNATFQWIPGHLDLLPQLVGAVAPGGWFAFAVPGNFGEPSHTIRRDLAAEAPYAEFTADVANPDAYDARTYLEVLTGLGCEVDAWESTYLHVLTGEDPVFSWISGTSLRPTVQALPEALRPQFEAELRRRLAAVYPVRDGQVTLPFRRVFVAARIPA